LARLSCNRPLALNNFRSCLPTAKPTCLLTSCPAVPTASSKPSWCCSPAGKSDSSLSHAPPKQQRRPLKRRQRRRLKKQRLKQPLKRQLQRKRRQRKLPQKRPLPRKPRQRPDFATARPKRSVMPLRACRGAIPPATTRQSNAPNVPVPF